ncbi:MAG: nucleotidyltransferase family protein [Acidimicrobiia bacterium]|nr:nucleotidyltransferase family protein [Acidimicrobiia bacterium]
MDENHEQGWAGGRPQSEGLIRLAADMGLDRDLAVTAGLIELAQRHGLIGILADHTADELVRAIHVRETTRSRIIESHLSRVVQRLDERGVRAAVLKGPAIAGRYRNPAHRAFSDLDLLVPESDLNAAMDVLSSDEAVSQVPPKRPRADKRNVLFRDLSGIRFNVDLHWDLFSYSQFRGRSTGATDNAWSEARPDEKSDWGPVWVLPEPYRVGFLAAHAVLDHRFRLILFRDLLELALSDINWSSLAELSRRWGLRSTTYLACWMAKAMLGAAVPDAFLDSVRPRSAPLSYLEWALPRTDVVRFDGHTVHPINLATVLLNDSRIGRVSLASRAPVAIPGWRRRVAADLTRQDSPRTLIVVSTDRRRGAEVFTERLRDGLVRRGWVVDAVALSRSEDEPRADVEPLLERPLGDIRFDLAVVRALRGRVKTFRPDVIVANGGATLRYGSAARLGLGCKLVYIGIGEPEYWIRSRLSRWANRFLLKGTDHVLAVSKTTRDQLIDLEHSLADRIDAAFTGVPDHLFELDVEEREAFLKVLMVGSLTEEKDPLTALRAVAEVDRAVIRFVGDGPLLGTLQEEAARLGMDSRVEFAGSVPDVTSHLRWGDLLLLTSLSEGLPGAILEAGAAGLPTVSVDVGGVREAVIDGETGVVVRNREKLVEAIRALDADRDRLARMGAAARRHMSANFTLDDVIAAYARHLMKVWK